MSEKRRPPAAEPLPGMTEDTGLGTPRRVERAVIESLEEADLGGIDAAAGALARELARAVDVASVRNDPYGIAAAGRELREQLIRLKLDPSSRGGAASDLGAWLDSLEDEHPTRAG